MNRIRNHTHAVAGALLATAMLVPIAFAQDTHYRPAGEQIPSPDCLTLSNAYSAALAGGYHPCPAETHEAWLKDVRIGARSGGSASAMTAGDTARPHCNGRNPASFSRK